MKRDIRVNPYKIEVAEKKIEKYAVDVKLGEDLGLVNTDLQSDHLLKTYQVGYYDGYKAALEFLKGKN